jgi:hypothetical protein
MRIQSGEGETDGRGEVARKEATGPGSVKACSNARTGIGPAGSNDETGYGGEAAAENFYGFTEVMDFEWRSLKLKLLIYNFFIT